jgi:tricorn protease
MMNRVLSAPLCVVRWVVVGVLASTGVAQAAEVDLARYPSVSPDGSHVVFSWRGDLWKAPTAGGTALRLTASPADDLRSAWSPDGSMIAFESERSGYRNLHIMDADGANIRQITHTDDALNLAGFSRDGANVLFSARMEGDVYRAQRPYQVSVEGGPIARLHDAFGQWPDAHPERDAYVFTRGGSRWSRKHYRGPDNRDLWLYEPDDAEFIELTTWTGNDGKPRWRDAKTVLYLSDRELDAVNLWALDLTAGEDRALRLTNFREDDVHDFDVSADGSTVVVANWQGLHALKLPAPTGGLTPKRIAIEAPADASPRDRLLDVTSEVDEARLSPDGKTMAFIARGDVYVRAVNEGSVTRRVTDSFARERHLAWSPDNSRLYFVSDESGSDSIYAATVTRTRSELKERFEEITSPPAEEDEQAAENEANEDEAAEDEQADADTDAESDEADADEPSKDDDEDKDEDKSPKPGARWADALRFEVMPIVEEGFDDREPALSPDGTQMLFRRTRGDIHLLDLMTGEHRQLVDSWDIFGLEYRWSPDGDFVAFSNSDTDFNTEVFIVPADGSMEPVNISRHPDSDYAPRWSADGRILSFLSERTDNETDVWMVYLDKDLESYTSQELETYYEEAAEAAKKLGAIDPIDFKPADDEADAEEADDDAQDEQADDAEPPFELADLDDAYLRLRRVTRYPRSEGSLDMTPAADRFVFSAAGGAGGESGVYSINWKGEDEKRLSPPASLQHLSADGSRVIMVRGGRAMHVPVTGGSSETVNIDFTIELDHEAINDQKFDELVRTLGRTFYHPDMKGLEWDELGEQYGAFARRAHTADEFGYVANRLLGELNASHLGVFPAGGPDLERQAIGRLGVDTEPSDEGGFVVTNVIPLGPADVGAMRMREGDAVVAIELERLAPGDTLMERLRGRVGRETIVTVRRSLEPLQEGGEERTEELDLLITPISGGAQDRLKYNAWQRRNAELVDQWSDGRLGYLHIRAMGGADLIEFERDLYAAGYGNDGLLIDVRNNGGGWTTDRVLASIMAQPHAYTIPRGAERVSTDAYPRDRLYIQRYTKPINMLCNEKSFSNAEIISHAFKSLGRGTLVGQQTYGGVISTSGFRLVDGTFVRQPFRGWYLMDGTDMENNGAMPDIVIPQTPEDEVQNNDRQLKAAVEDLLSRLD